MRVLQTILIFIVLVCKSSSGDNQPIIDTSLGTVKGHYKQSYGGRTFAAFEGIPYAKPPVGQLRFAEPQEPEPWLGIWEATTKHVCIQLPIKTTKTRGEEDCLYLNVYVPNDTLTRHENMNVLVYIHGGAFMVGNPLEGGPGYLMDRDLVFVNINYRLGVMGFLSTQDDVVSGNNGLKDQVQAFKWIQKNIKHFGGNPKSVTIAGLSAGGASVHFQYFSPLSKQLFHRGIIQSGTVLGPWAIQDAPLETARRLAALVGCTFPSTKDLIKCMRQRSATQIVENVKEFNAFSGFPNAPFAPVVENPSNSAFLTELPYKLLNSGSINDAPIFQTICTEEGILGYSLVNDTLDQLNALWKQVLPYVLDYNYTVAAEDKPLVAQKIKEFYFNDKPVTQENVLSFIKLFGDRYFMLAFEKSSRMHARLNKSLVFSYIFAYKADISSSYPHAHLGVGHGEDTQLIYQRHSRKLSERDVMIKETLLDFVTSFAKDGVPKSGNIEWEEVKNLEDFNYLLVHNPGDIKMVSEKEVAPTEFWDSLPIKENEKFD